MHKSRSNNAPSIGFKEIFRSSRLIYLAFMYEMVMDPMNFVNYYYKLSKLKTLKYWQYQKIFKLLSDIINVFMGQRPNNHIIHLRKI
ncbi:MAG: hypothetical protein CMD78_06455 [Gammaproteobacteria bacterium]|nr:hypothetical protein [Gammaproteobacteria bacterium]